MSAIYYDFYGSYCMAPGGVGSAYSFNDVKRGRDININFSQTFRIRPDAQHTEFGASSGVGIGFDTTYHPTGKYIKVYNIKITQSGGL